MVFMKVLITGGASRLAQAIAADLSKDHTVRMMESVPVEAGEKYEFMRGSILNPDEAWRAVRGIDALIHTNEPPPDIPLNELEHDQMVLELATRGTHTLFTAAVDAGVRNFVYAGTLSIFDPYPDDVYITENWKPLPSPDITQMSKYLGELTCREFARDYLVKVTCLRLGQLVLEEEVVGEPPNILWLDLRDAAQAFRCALSHERSHKPWPGQSSATTSWWTERWAIFHICADIPNPKFLIEKHRHTHTPLGYNPTHNFKANWEAKNK